MRRKPYIQLLALFIVVCFFVSGIRVIWLIWKLPRQVPPASGEREITDNNDLAGFGEEVYRPWDNNSYKANVFVVASLNDLRAFFEKEGCSEIEVGVLPAVASMLKYFGSSGAHNLWPPAPRLLLYGRSQDLSFVKVVPKARNGRYLWRLPLKNKSGMPYWICVYESHGNTDNIMGGMVRTNLLIGPKKYPAIIYKMGN